MSKWPFRNGDPHQVVGHERQLGETRQHLAGPALHLHFGQHHVLDRPLTGAQAVTVPTTWAPVS